MNTVHWPSTGDAETSLTSINLSENLNESINQYLRQNNLHDALSQHIETLYLPMANWLIGKHKDKQPLVVGINGAQGSGKSTLAELLEIIFKQGGGLKVARLSIDDLYLEKKERQMLARNAHPLFITRGAPGTHNIDLGLDLFTKLSNSCPQNISIPRFSKAIDERLPPDQWETITTPVDIILFEGWCVGAVAQADIELHEPVNQLEADEDSHMQWRTYANEQLAGKYQALFKQIDVLVMLKVPSMKHVIQWRGKQEQRLVASIENGKIKGMNQKELERFIMHYERLTRHQLDNADKYADVVLSLDENQQVALIKLQNIE